MERIEHNRLHYYRYDALSDVKHGIFTRHGGVSAEPWSSLNMGGTVGDDPEAVRQNHEFMYDALNVNRARACSVWQVHGVDTVVANNPISGRSWLAQADALVTDRPDTPLVMRFADCTPLLFYDPVQGVIGMAHAGWRGTVQGVGQRTVQTMIDTYGCKPANIRAVIGPSIGPDSFQVGEEVVAAAYAYFGTIEGLIRRDPIDGTAYFDLWAANRLDLQRAGVEQITLAAIDTFQQTADFFSHRAEKGRTGRFGAVISL